MRTYFLFLLASLFIAAVGGAVAYADRPELVTCIADKIFGASGSDCEATLSR